MDSVRRNKRRSLAVDDNVTPRTLIQGFLQTAQTVRQSPRKRARMTPSRTPGATPSASSVRGSKTPRTLPKPAPSNRRRSNRIETLATPGGSNPTPRGLITGFLKAADIQTPAVHIGTRRSSPLKQPTPSVQRNAFQDRAESTNSSSVESPIDHALSRFIRPQQRERRGRRQHAIDREEFAERVRDRIGQEESEVTTDEDEMERSRDATGNRTQLDSIAEEGRDSSPPKKDYRIQSFVEEPASERSSRSSRSRRSLLENSSFQVPSAKVPDDSVSEMRDSKASHLSGSLEEDSIMVQASQETIRVPHSSHSDSDNEERGDESRQDESRREESRQEESKTVEEGLPQGNETDDETPDDGIDQEEVEMDMEDDDGVFDEENAIAPTQPTQLHSAVKGSRSYMASPLNTPYLRDRGKHPTPEIRRPTSLGETLNRKGPVPVYRKDISKKPAIPGSRKPPTALSLPKSLTRGIFTHFSKARVPRNALTALDEVSSKFFKNVSKDLMAYCKHAGRQTIEQADVELLMHRQRLVSDKEPLQSLIEKYLPMEYREELIPMARSGNKVYPKMPKK
ncbi:centromere protein T-like [Lytechinus pictus]|uniref:centromere protein T-like n=1 Tax=Lytechinus pictus TaxID=7653 RepID=UPI0030B9E453